MNLRKLARGKLCQIRIPGYCTHDPHETVLCHGRFGGVAGMGQKPPDLIGAWGCNMCHAIVDDRVATEYSRLEVAKFFLDGMCRTLAQVSKELEL